MKTISLLFVSIIILTSCRKAELPVPSPDLSDSKGAGELITTSLTLSPNYDNIIYFDFGTNENKGQSIKTNWDLGFSCSSDTPYIIINYAKVMFASKVSNQTFEEITNTTNFNIHSRPEHPTGQLDSLAIKDGSIYLLDRGYDNAGTHLGYFKMEIIDHTTSHFTGRFANINGTNEQTITIQKNNDYNFVYMKWNPTGTITTPTIEPEKTEWDIVFTQYTEIFYEPEYMPYSVVGCLTNPHNTTAIQVFNKDFVDIDLEYAQTLVLSNDRNAIGYSWKTFLYAQNIFQIHYEKVYVVKDNEGDYYKLRFIDFYNQIGEKGTPTFEYQRL